MDVIRAVLERMGWNQVAGGIVYHGLELSALLLHCVVRILYPFFKLQ